MGYISMNVAKIGEQQSVQNSTQQGNLSNRTQVPQNPPESRREPHSLLQNMPTRASTKTAQRRARARANGPTFNQILTSAPPANIIASLRGINIPARLSPQQAGLVRDKLTKFHPDILCESPFVDAHGKSIEINLTDDDLYCWFNLAKRNWEYTPKKTQDLLAGIFNNYAAHRQWQNYHMEIRTVKKEDVPPDQQKLVGQEGVYVKKLVTKGSIVAIFDGMLLEDKNDIKIDKKLRKLASCDKYYAPPAKGKMVEGMGISMKFNASNKPGSPRVRGERENLEVTLLEGTIKSTGEKLNAIMVYRAARDIEKDEQLCYWYDITQSRK
jgi:hypothetical protein